METKIQKLLQVEKKSTAMDLFDKNVLNSSVEEGACNCFKRKLRKVSQTCTVADFIPSSHFKREINQAISLGHWGIFLRLCAPNVMLLHVFAHVQELDFDLTRLLSEFLVGDQDMVPAETAAEAVRDLEAHPRPFGHVNKRRTGICWQCGFSDSSNKNRAPEEITRDCLFTHLERIKGPRKLWNMPLVSQMLDQCGKFMSETGTDFDTALLYCNGEGIFQPEDVPGASNYFGRRERSIWNHYLLRATVQKKHKFQVGDTVRYFYKGQEFFGRVERQLKSHKWAIEGTTGSRNEVIQLSQLCFSSDQGTCPFAIKPNKKKKHSPSATWAFDPGPLNSRAYTFGELFDLYHSAEFAQYNLQLAMQEYLPGSRSKAVRCALMDSLTSEFFDVFSTTSSLQDGVKNICGSLQMKSLSDNLRRMLFRKRLLNCAQPFVSKSLVHTEVIVSRLIQDSFTKFQREMALIKIQEYRKCPACGKWIYRFSGCNHMTCICRAEFDFYSSEALSFEQVANMGFFSGTSVKYPELTWESYLFNSDNTNSEAALFRYCVYLFSVGLLELEHVGLGVFHWFS